MSSNLLHRIYDFGLNDEQAAAVRARKAPTERELAAMVVDESELKRFGRWAGCAAPRRWVPR